MSFRTKNEEESQLKYFSLLDFSIAEKAHFEMTLVLK